MESNEPAKQRLLILTSTLPTSESDPSPRFVLDLAIRLKPKFHITLLAPHGPGLPRKQSLDGIEVHRFRYLPARFETLAYSGGIPDRLRANPLNYLAVPFFLIAQTLAVARLIRRDMPSVVHAHWWMPQGLTAMLGRWLARKPIPVVCTLHGGDVFSFQGPVMRALMRAVLRRCASICPVSTAVRDSLPADIAGRHSTIIAPMGVDTRQIFRPVTGITPDDRKILFVGRLAAKKGVDWLLHAFALALQDRPDLHLNIVGGGPMGTELKELADQLGIFPRVSFSGPVPHRELPARYSESCVSVIPSIRAKGGDREGLGLTAIEALACGCPVIVSDTPSLADVVTDGRNGVVVAQNDTDALARAMIRLASDQQLRRRLRADARVSVRQFDWEAAADRYATLLSGALAPK